jgi:CDP-diacylglycerol--glycerol-3-phosphate 3-phosphatidyltransferase/cardiolipin synthase
MLTLPNLLTLSRIVAMPVMVLLLWRPGPGDYALAFLLYVLVGLTDYFDGYLARAQGAVSKLGIFLDPIADKIMVATVIVMLVFILVREIAVSGLREFLAQLSVSIPVSQMAKWKTTFQLISLGAIILGGALPSQPWISWVGFFCLWAAAGLTLVTGWDYLRVGLKHMD